MTASGLSAQVESATNLTCYLSNLPPSTTAKYQWKRIYMSVIPEANLPTYGISSVGVFDAGVYTCEVTVSDIGNSPHVISATGSVNITLTVTSK